MFRNFKYVSAAFFTFVSCAYLQGAPARSANFKIDVLPSRVHAVSIEKIYEDDDELVIYGDVSDGEGTCNTKGHIDLAILDGENNVLVQKVLKHRTVGLKAKRRGGWIGADFRTRFPFQLPENSTVRVKYHGPECYAHNDERCRKELQIQNENSRKGELDTPVSFKRDK